MPINSSKEIFIINGSAGVGKDTLVQMVCNASNGKVMNYSSIDKVKEIARSIGWTGAKTERDRKFLSDLKLLCIAYNDMPLLDLEKKVEEFRASDNEILFLHIREPEEIEKARKRFNARTMLVTRASVTQVTSNPADKNVFQYNYDIVFDADCTLDELQARANVLYNDCTNNNVKAKY